MALFKFQNLNKHGNLRTRIVHSPTSQFKYKCEGLGKFVNVQRFKYEYHHSHISPQMQVVDMINLANKPKFQDSQG